jgi:hypothetical protein
VLLAAVGGGNDVQLFDEMDREVELAQTWVNGLGGMCSAGLELKPTSELLPNHNYKLVASGAEPEDESWILRTTATFTTGGGPIVAKETPAPDMQLAVLDATSYFDGCTESDIQACLFTSGEEVFEVHVERGEGTSRYVGWAGSVQHLALGQPDQETCITLFARDAAGNLSAPNKRCFDTTEAPLLPNDQGPGDSYVDCGSAGVQALITDDDAGENAGPTPKPAAADGGGDPPKGDVGDDISETHTLGNGVDPDENSGCSIAQQTGQGSTSHTAVVALLGACATVLARRKLRSV